MLRNNKVVLSIVAGALVLGLIGAACSTGFGATSPSEIGGTPQLIASGDLTYMPTNLTVKAGGTLIVRNTSGSITHSFTVDSTTINQTLPPSTTFKIPIDLDPGIYDFRCKYFPSMHGTLTVK